MRQFALALMAVVLTSHGQTKSLDSTFDHLTFKLDTTSPKSDITDEEFCKRVPNHPSCVGSKDDGIASPENDNTIDEFCRANPDHLSCV